VFVRDVFVANFIDVTRERVGSSTNIERVALASARDRSTATYEMLFLSVASQWLVWTGRLFPVDMLKHFFDLIMKNDNVYDRTGADS